MTRGVPMNYGQCDGGPWSRCHMAHPEAVYVVPIEEHSRKVRVGIRRGTPGYKFGEYRFEAGAWHWHAPSEAKTCEQPE